MEEKENIYYVYLHRRATDNKVFYVGKGKGKRAFQTNGRNDRWNKTYKKHGRVVEIVFEDLSQQEAFDIEIDTITEMRYHYGETLCNMTNGGDGLSGFKHSRETKEKISISLVGKIDIFREINADRVEYNFLKVDTREVVKASRVALRNMYNLPNHALNLLFKKDGIDSISNGFALLRDGESIDDCITRSTARKNNYNFIKPKSPRYTDVLCFVAADSTAIWATLDDFESRVGHKMKGLVQQPHKIKVLHGWSLMRDCSFEDAVRKAQRKHRGDNNRDSNIYKFINDRGLIFEGTRSDLAERFNFKWKQDVNLLFSKAKKRKSVHGWSLYEGEL